MVRELAAKADVPSSALRPPLSGTVKNKHQINKILFKIRKTSGGGGGRGVTSKEGTKSEAGKSRGVHTPTPWGVWLDCKE